MMTDTTVEEFKIPESNVWQLEQKVQKLNKRALKLGAPEIVLNELRVEQEFAGKTTVGEPFYRDYHIYTIEGVAPRLSGWKFIATLDHDNEVPLVLTSPQETLPKEYFNASSDCGHCHHKRYRRKTFIVQNVETGEYKQVGSSCLKDFLGHGDPKMIIRYFEWFSNLITDLSDLEDLERVSGYDRLSKFKFNRILELAAMVIREEREYMSRSRAQESENENGEIPPSTGDLITAYIFEDNFRKGCEYDGDNKEDLVTAEKALEWTKAFNDPDSSYQHTIKALIKNNVVTPKYFGYVASVVGCYLRDEAKKRDEQTEKSKMKNEWFGEIKKRIEHIITVTKFIPYESDFGNGLVIKMLDDEGRSVSWFTGYNNHLELDKTYKVKLTVKKHDEYKGWKQTVVNRVTIIEEI